MEFSQARIKFNQQYSNKDTLEKSLCTVDGKFISNIALRDVHGGKNEEFYKWEFIYSMIQSGRIPSRDYIGAEIYFPKGNIHSAPIKIDSVVFSDISWLDYYRKYRENPADVESLQKVRELAIEVWLLHAVNYKHFLAKHLEIPDTKTVKEIITDLLNESSTVEYPILYTPYYVDTRMSAQKSYFLVWGTKKEAFEDQLVDEQLFMELPEEDNGIREYGTAQETASLFKFLIHADRKQPLLHELNMVGINEKTLFPGLDGIGRYIERQYRFDYNEAVESF